MSSQTLTRESTGICSDDGIDTLRDWIRGADAILVGAGAGLSAAAGLEYGRKRFTSNFPDFISKYGYRDMYSASFQRYTSPEEHWAYWSRHIMLNRYLPEDNGTYAALRRVVEGKDWFVITTNVDHCFQRFGFEKDRLFYTQGDYGLWQCARPCCRETFDNESAVRRMYAEQRDMRIPSELVPCCSRCGGPVTMNLRVDDRFVQDEGWYRAAERYARFAERAMDRRTLYLELGVGYNTPGIIKFPFQSMAHENPDGRYAAVSIGSADVPSFLRDRGIGIDADIGSVLEALSGRFRHEPLVPPSPVLHRVEDGREALPQGRERVLHPGRDLGIDRPRDQLVLLHAAELLCQDLLRDPRHRSHELVEALGPGA